MDGLTPLNSHVTAYTASVAVHMPPQGEQAPETQISKTEVHAISKELQDLANTYNKRLEFRYSEDLAEVIVKVIDRNTDKVIKELPSEELQRVHLRIREALGLLVNEEA